MDRGGRFSGLGLGVHLPELINRSEGLGVAVERVEQRDDLGAL
jgi:hypothetical protein